MEQLDVVIIGAGPAGLTASIYASCFHLNHLILGQVIGGQMTLAPDIVNYPGFMEISGLALTKQMTDQVKGRGGTLLEDIVVGITREAGNLFSATTQKGQIYHSKVIILATGTERRRLNVPGEMQYAGHGVHYCAICDKQDYQGKPVAVIGGGNAAAQSSVQLSHAALRVSVLYRGEELRCEAIWSKRLEEAKNVEIIYNTKVSEILGDGQKVTGVKIVKDREEKILQLDHVFIEIGGVPGTSLIAPLGVTLDPGGYIIVNEKLETNIPGVFAAGDLVSYGLSLEQISTSVGLGARAASSAFSYLKQKKAPISWGSSLIQRQ